MTRKDPQLNLRLPAELKEMLEHAAEENSRSVTAETVERLRDSFSPQGDLPGALFLMARQEMRAAQAEVEVMAGKASIATLAWALKHAMSRIQPAELEANADLAEAYKTWEDHLARVKSDVFDFEADPGDFDRVAREKLEALRAAQEQSQKILNIKPRALPDLS